MKDGEYQEQRQPIKIEKQWDLYEMRDYCTRLTTEEKNYWYPEPSENLNSSDKAESVEEKAQKVKYKWMYNLCNNEEECKEMEELLDLTQQ